MMRVIARTTIAEMMDIKIIIVDFDGKFPWWWCW
jgi:hypothetical protein